MALLSSCNSILPVGILTTVGIKELLDKEQIGFKELFTDYHQLFYTINLLLNKELLPI